MYPLFLELNLAKITNAIFLNKKVIESMCGGVSTEGCSKKNSADAKQVQDEMKQKKQCRKYLWLA